jgi:hypothetical protein
VDVAIEIRPGLDLLRVVLTGIRGDAQASLALWHKIADHIQQHRAMRVLVVNNLVGKLPTAEELKAIVASLAKRWSAQVRVAIVLADTGRIDEYEHAALASIEQGRNFLVFTSEDAAVVWLRHGLDARA